MPRPKDWLYFNEIFDETIELNPYSHATRYPDDCYTIPTVQAAESCIEKALKIFEFVKNKIESEAL